jgi:transcription elongation GreA/GreB family factor
MYPSKSRIVQALSRSAREALEAAERAQSIAADEATSEHSKAEGKYDTRATEASYLARGQAERVVKLRELVAWYGRLEPTERLETVTLGALVVLDGDSTQVLFVCPVGGANVVLDGTKVKTVSFAAPLGRALKGLAQGDEFELKTPAGAREFEVIHLS